MNNIQTFHFQSHDFDEISASLSRWDQTYHQLSAGTFFGDVDYVQINGMEIFELHWEQVIHYQGLTPPGTIGFGLPKNFTGESRYLYRSISNDELLIQQCGSEGDLIGSRNFMIQVLTIEEQRFFDKIANITGKENRQQLRHINHVPLDPVIAATLRGKFHELIQHSSQLKSATNNQFTFVTALSEKLLHLIANIVISGDLEQTTIRLERQRQLVKKAEEYVWSYPTVPPRIDTLSANIGTSERSLRDAFRACTGMSAGAYLKTFRLNQVRSALKSCSEPQIRVQDVAFDWGFSHMGQFAADYKRLFGESPSETLCHGKKFQLAVF